MILSDGLISPASQLQTQQVITSHTCIRSHTEYLIQTYYIFVPIRVEIDEKFSHNGGVQ